jgi:hypothetical protein
MIARNTPTAFIIDPRRKTYITKMYIMSWHMPQLRVEAEMENWDWLVYQDRCMKTSVEIGQEREVNKP